MSALVDIETRLVGAIVGEGRALSGFSGPVGADAATGLGIYVEAYRLRLLEALRHDYPELLALAGEAEFEKIGGAYIAEHPSRGPNLRHFGRHLAGFLAGAATWRARPELADRAALEWAEGEAFDAADALPLDAAKLAAISPETWPEIGFRFHDSVRRVDLKAAPKSWLFWRKDLEVMKREVEPDEAAALDAALGGARFEAICRTIARFVGEDAAPSRAAGLLRVWLDDGLIVGLTEV